LNELLSNLIVRIAESKFTQRRVTGAYAG